jgi:hypothetical protein
MLGGLEHQIGAFGLTIVLAPPHHRLHAPQTANRAGLLARQVGEHEGEVVAKHVVIRADADGDAAAVAAVPAASAGAKIICTNPGGNPPPGQQGKCNGEALENLNPAGHAPPGQNE